MPYWRLFYHLVWATKERLPLIDPTWEPRLYAGLASAVEACHARVYAIGGVADHVHVAVSIPPSIKVSDVVARIKGSSAHLVNHEITPDAYFGWQGSYGVLSFGERSLERIVSYVQGQKTHHAEGRLMRALERWEDDTG